MMVDNMAVTEGASSWGGGEVAGLVAAVTSCLWRLACEAVALATPLDALRLGGIPGTVFGKAADTMLHGKQVLGI